MVQFGAAGARRGPRRIFQKTRSRANKNTLPTWAKKTTEWINCQLFLELFFVHLKFTQKQAKRYAMTLFHPETHSQLVIFPKPPPNCEIFANIPRNFRQSDSVVCDQSGCWKLGHSKRLGDCFSLIFPIGRPQFLAAYRRLWPFTGRLQRPLAMQKCEKIGLKLQTFA